MLMVMQFVAMTSGFVLLLVMVDAVAGFIEARRGGSRPGRDNRMEVRSWTQS